MTTVFIAFILSFLALVFFYLIIVLAFNLQYGQAGVANFGIVAFPMLGAYITAMLMVDPATISYINVGLNLPFLPAFLIAVTATGLIAWLISSVVRFGEEELVVLTLAFAAFVHITIENEIWLTGGTKGIYISSILDEKLGLLGYNLAFAGILLAAVLLTYYFTRKLNFSQFGRILNAARQDETKAKSLGINTVSYRTKAFVIGCMIMAAAGSLYMYLTLKALPDTYPVLITFVMWIALLLGGSGNNMGAVLGIVIFMMLDFFAKLFLNIPGHPEIAAGLKFVIIGLVLIVVIIRRPQGILGSKRSSYE